MHAMQGTHFDGGLRGTEGWRGKTASAAIAGVTWILSWYTSLCSTRYRKRSGGLNDVSGVDRTEQHWQHPARHFWHRRWRRERSRPKRQAGDGLAVGLLLPLGVSGVAVPGGLAASAIHHLRSEHRIGHDGGECLHARPWVGKSGRRMDIGAARGAVTDGVRGHRAWDCGAWRFLASGVPLRGAVHRRYGGAGDRGNHFHGAAGAD